MKLPSLSVIRQANSRGESSGRAMATSTTFSRSDSGMRFQNRRGGRLGSDEPVIAVLLVGAVPAVEGAASHAPAPRSVLLTDSSDSSTRRIVSSFSSGEALTEPLALRESQTSFF